MWTPGSGDQGSMCRAWNDTPARPRECGPISTTAWLATEKGGGQESVSTVIKRS
jgi:hypothetical protein